MGVCVDWEGVSVVWGECVRVGNVHWWLWSQ